jgi:hypothetical protein
MSASASGSDVRTNDRLDVLQAAAVSGRGAAMFAEQCRLTNRLQCAIARFGEDGRSNIGRDPGVSNMIASSESAAVRLGYRLDIFDQRAFIEGWATVAPMARNQSPRKLAGKGPVPTQPRYGWVSV